MNRLSLLLAWRYPYGTRSEKSIATMAKVCFASTLIGSFSLALILSIMSGFEKVTHAQLQGIHANIIVRAYGDNLNTPALATIFTNEFPEIACWSPTTTQQALMQSSLSQDLSNVVIVKGIDPEKEALTSIIANKITHSDIHTKTLSALLHNNSVIIGKGLAQELNIKAGSPATILFTDPESGHGNKIAFAHKEVMVSGIFATGIEEFDNGLLLCSLELLHQMWPDAGIEQINIKLAPNASETDVINRLNKRLGLQIYSWKDLYPALVSALKLEKYAMLFILALITLVASMNILSLTFMNITQKSGDRALLQSLGMSSRAIRTVFLLSSTGIAFFGTCCGLLLAGLIGYFLATYPFITLPDTYYMSHLPISMELPIFAGVFALVMVLSFIAAWIPSRSIGYSSLAHVLRHEG